jgi:hypothetical protein
MKNLSIFLLVVALSSTAIGQVDLNSGLVGYYSLDNAGDTIAVNLATGTDIMPDGQILNDPEWVDGISGSALRFSNAGTAHVEFGTYDPSADTDELSISVWINWAGLDGGWHSICGKRDGWDPPLIMWSLCLDMNNGGIQFETNTPGGKIYIISPAPPVDEWCHVALIFDGYWAQMFMDGDMVVEGEMTFGEAREAGFHLGCGTTGGVDCFSGILDEFRVYNRMLNEAEVLELSKIPTSVEQRNQNVISDYVLHQNYPNPFNPATNISYALKSNGKVRLSVYDVMGREVAVLVDGIQSAGNHEVQFSGANLTSGIYFYKLQTAAQVITRKMTLVK